jgi:hypothetical protein
MEILELKVGDKVFTNPKKINDILLENKFYWLIDSEMSDAVLEIEKGTLIWHSGIFMTGNWKYGIFKNGGFYGVFENGIFEDGHFDGLWKSGINLKNN